MNRWAHADTQMRAVLGRGGEERERRYASKAASREMGPRGIEEREGFARSQAVKAPIWRLYAAREEGASAKCAS